MSLAPNGQRLDRRERLQFQRPPAGAEPVPEIAADAGDAGQAPAEIAESDSLGQIVEFTEHGTNPGQSRLIAGDGDDKENRRLR